MNVNHLLDEGASISCSMLTAVGVTKRSGRSVPGLAVVHAVVNGDRGIACVAQPFVVLWRMEAGETGPGTGAG